MTKTLDQRVTMLEALYGEHDRMITNIMHGNPTTPDHLVFSWPVGDITRRTLAPWFDATGFNVLYNNGTAYHCSNDLNLAAYADSGQPVFAVADGVLRFSSVAKGWQQKVVVIEHALEDGRLIWSRYAHIAPLSPLVGMMVKRGELIAHIADYTPAGPHGDHLDFGMSWKDLGKYPDDWPGMNRQRVTDDYVDGCKFIAGRLP